MSKQNFMLIKHASFLLYNQKHIKNIKIKAKTHPETDPEA